MTGGGQSNGPEPEVSKRISVDLIAFSVSLAKLLHAVDTFPNGGLYEGHHAKEAVRRYLTLWLPLLKATPTASREKLQPPLDVAWVWLVHRLNPTAYQADMQQKFGEALDPTPAQAFRFTDGVSSEDGRWTAQQWAGRTGKAEAFYPPSSASPEALVDPNTGAILTPSSKPSGMGDKPVASFDLESALARQAPFLHSILRACYLERPFLEEAFKCYCRFLLMARDATPDRVIVPMYHIDLMWHTHMACSAAYVKDSLSIMDRVLTHDDTLPHNALVDHFGVTKAEYEERFGELYNPPITQQVPEHIRHPSEEQVGATILRFYNAPTTLGLAAAAAVAKAKASGRALQAARQQVATARNTAMYIRASDKDRLTQARSATSVARSRCKVLQTTAQQDAKAAKVAVAAAAAAAKAGNTVPPAELSPQAFKVANVFAEDAAVKPVPRAGGHALYILYLMLRELDKAEHGCLACLCSQDRLRKKAARRVTKQASKFRDFKNLPHDDSHEYWLTMALRPTWSDDTLAQMPPGGWPAAVALGKPVSAGDIASGIVAGQPCAVAAPVSAGDVQLAGQPLRTVGYYRNECYWGGAGYYYYDPWLYSNMQCAMMLNMSCYAYIGMGGYYVGGCDATWDGTVGDVGGAAATCGTSCAACSAGSCGAGGCGGSGGCGGG